MSGRLIRFIKRESTFNTRLDDKDGDQQMVSLSPSSCIMRAVIVQVPILCPSKKSYGAKIRNFPQDQEIQGLQGGVQVVRRTCNSAD